MEAGSSFSHFDQATYAVELMKPALPNGTAIHSLGTRTLGALRDIGWGDELVIQAFGYNTTGVVEWICFRNNSSVSVNLSDYAIGDEERQGGTEGMFLLPNVNLAAGALFTMRAQRWHVGDRLYPGDPNPTYCWNCTSGYTNLTNYSLWGGTAGDLANTGDEIVLLRTNGGQADTDGVTDDFIIDAMLWNRTKRTSIPMAAGSAKRPIATSSPTAPA
ncbi:MAG: lamin tail domain-containing protein [Anaerolineae bacterium]